MSALVFGAATSSIFIAEPVHAQTTGQGVIARTVGRIIVDGAAITAPIARFSVRAGDAVAIATVSYATENCEPAFIGLERLQVLVAPPELEITFEPQETLFRTKAGVICHEPMSGGLVMATASDVARRKESIVKFRLVLNTKLGRVAATYSCRVVVLPRAIRGIDGLPKRADVTDPETQSALKLGDGKWRRRVRSANARGEAQQFTLPAVPIAATRAA